ncbi:uncharacterized protein LOC18789694 [Prunus persica]|uniref:uncharacterized protein LOC18789694 n=1 Tax=Prunus persica TaxID=3760 RepID=UPI0002C20A7D|nr:uncharacterized protein LOC18789694 [Prunus persica]
MGGHGAVEVAKTVLEVADVAWTAMECGHHHLHHDADHKGHEGAKCVVSDEELEALREENRRLRNSLEQNLKLLENLSESPSLLNDCPPDLYARLVATVDSNDFLTRIRALKQESENQFPFKVASGSDLEAAEILINVDHEEPSWWVWVTEDMLPGKVEERSGIDNESYVLVSEEHVVDGIANFMAKCIVSNPKARNLTPEELQKIVAKAMGGVSKLEKVLGIWHAGKLFYALSTWGLALTGLYRSRAILKFAAMGVHTTSKVIMRAM